MGAFGLIVHCEGMNLKNYSFATKDQRWQIVLKPHRNHFVGCPPTIAKTRTVTILEYKGPENLITVDNTSVAMKYYEMNGTIMYSSLVLENDTVSSDDYVFLGGWCLPPSSGFQVFNVPENRMLSFPMTIPELTLDNLCLFDVESITTLSKATVLYTIMIRRKVAEN